MKGLQFHSYTFYRTFFTFMVEFMKETVLQKPIIHIEVCGSSPHNGTILFTKRTQQFIMFYYFLRIVTQCLYCNLNVIYCFVSQKSLDRFAISFYESNKEFIQRLTLNPFIKYSQQLTYILQPYSIIDCEYRKRLFAH